MRLTAYTIFHVTISLLAIFSGFAVLFDLPTGKRLDGWTAFFLISTVATSVTGFFFPIQHFMPSHAIGRFALLVLSASRDPAASSLRQAMSSPNDNNI